LSPETVATLQSGAIAAMEGAPHPYHNAVHVRRVLERVRELSRVASLSPLDTQLLELGAAFHDFGHAGNTYRQLVPSAPRNDLSNEEFAALAADEAVATYLAPCQRRALQGLILATSFGQGDPEGIPAAIRATAYRPYRPVTVLEKLLAFADVSNALVSVEMFDGESAAVAAEGGLAALPGSMDEYFRRQLSFLQFVRARLEAIAASLGCSSAAHFEAEIAAAERFIEPCVGHAARGGATEMGRVYNRLAEERTGTRS
jgi:hypothetical protein